MMFEKFNVTFTFRSKRNVNVTCNDWARVTSIALKFSASNDSSNLTSAGPFPADFNLVLAGPARTQTVDLTVTLFRCTVLVVLNCMLSAVNNTDSAALLCCT